MTIDRPSETEVAPAREVRQSYVHASCGATTSMSLGLATVWAYMPTHFEATYCARCKLQFPAADFTWAGTDELLGS